MALVSGICGLCQQHDHHPDYLTLKYAEVKVSFSTHTTGGITQKDINIAKDIDTLL
jgi:4a-hydroxytetrahydrobiopterin dehydratase